MPLFCIYLSHYILEIIKVKTTKLHKGMPTSMTEMELGAAVGHPRQLRKNKFPFIMTNNTLLAHLCSLGTPGARL